MSGIHHLVISKVIFSYIPAPYTDKHLDITSICEQIVDRECIHLEFENAILLFFSNGIKLQLHLRLFGKFISC